MRARGHFLEPFSCGLGFFFVKWSGLCPFLNFLVFFLNPGAGFFARFLSVVIFDFRLITFHPSQKAKIQLSYQYFISPGVEIYCCKCFLLLLLLPLFVSLSLPRRGVAARAGLLRACLF